MLAAYGVAIAAVRTFSMKTIVIWIVAIHVVLLMAPPLQLTDLFNYLGYARLGAVHHLNPYTHGIGAEVHDPVYRFSTWHNLHSPYGPLFTAFTYPVSLLPIPVAYWVLKVFAVGPQPRCSSGSSTRSRRLLGKDPRFAVLFVAANPIYLMYAVGGFHNDFFMLVPSTAAIAFLLARRDRSAGAMLTARRRRQVHGGPAAAVPARRGTTAAATAAHPARRGAGGDPARRAARGPVRLHGSEPPGPEHAAHRLQRARTSSAT